MHAFRRERGRVACLFEESEVSLLAGLLGQLIELLLDEGNGAAGPGTRWLSQPAEEDDIFIRLEREMTPHPDFFEEAPNLDPVLQRLFPDPYPDDPEASHDFQRFTHAAQLDDKVGSARLMLSDLRSTCDKGRCAVPDEHAMAWLKSLTNVRLALAVRLGIEDAEDADRAAELPDEDPRSWIYAIYEWLGWVQESLLAAHE